MRSRPPGRICSYAARKPLAATGQAGERRKHNCPFWIRIFLRNFILDKNVPLFSLPHLQIVSKNSSPLQFPIVSSPPSHSEYIFFNYHHQRHEPLILPIIKSIHFTIFVHIPMQFDEAIMAERVNDAPTFRTNPISVQKESRKIDPGRLRRVTSAKRYLSIKRGSNYRAPAASLSNRPVN